MKAAVLHAFGQPPVYEDVPEPIPQPDELLVTVKAASLKNIDKAVASGRHYASGSALPRVMGVDGVGVLADGTRVYTGGVLRENAMMAEKAVVPAKSAVPVPNGLSDAVAAALPNAAMSSWVALEYRAQIRSGETVLVMGATGVSGSLAVQIAKLLGAGWVIAVGRNESALDNLRSIGADQTLSLNRSRKDLVAAFTSLHRKRHIDIVLDYLWGPPAEALLAALTGGSLESFAPRTRYVEIGQMAGPTITLAGGTLRSTPIELYGSGGGSIPLDAIMNSFPRFMAAAAQGKLAINVEEVPLAQVEQTWNRAETGGRRIVFIP